MSKRQFLLSGLGAGAIAATGFGLVSTRAERSPAISVSPISGTKRQMPIPPLIESVNERPIELTMGQGEFELLPGTRIPTMGFNGPYLGPIVRVSNGQNIPVIYRNNCAEAIAVHSHGLHVPGEVDGGPQREIEPGSS